VNTISTQLVRALASQSTWPHKVTFADELTGPAAFAEFGDERTSPSVAHAPPAPVIGIRFLAPAPPEGLERELMAQEPSGL
jgi:hypothetical protein